MGLKEKAKNEAPHDNSRWVFLVIGFVLGVVVTLAVLQVTQVNNAGTAAENIQPNLELTATALIQEATGTASVLMTAPAQGTQPADMDPLLLTATAIIQQATQQASGS